ncbi:MAG: molybdate ABC transporter substrate-binding protein [Planctomycetes bacterium]|nr:molybdate ABC transporter substrate-binding protein [Planctomycetota bacterium]
MSWTYRIFAAVRACERRGAVNSFYLLLIGGFASLAVLSWMLWSMGKTAPSSDRTAGGLMVYCAAGQRLVVEKIAADYKREYGEDIQIQAGGSQSLLAQIEISKTGDIFLSADDKFTKLARQKGLVEETIPVATQKPVIAVLRGNPKHITKIQDLLRDDVKTALGNPDQSAIGDMTRTLMRKSGIWEALERRVTESGVFQATVNEAANSVKLKASDAAIVWDNTLYQYPDLEAVETPELNAGLAHVTLAVLKCSQRPTSALKFARYLTAADKGLLVFKKHGFDVADGDTWAEAPEIVFFCGSVNRRAVEPIIDAFQKREGVRVITSYDGCGTLTGKMRGLIKDGSPGFPDTYMACDVFYLQNVADLFQEAVNVSDTDIVIAVAKGNPKNIKTLQDLTKPNIRLAVGQAEKCTIGALTQKMLEAEKLSRHVQDNVVTETISSAALVPAVVTGSADAALAYATDTMAEADKIDTIRIDIPSSKAVQPFSIARSSKHKELSRRLYQEVTRSKDHFQTAGFHWRLDEPAKNTTTKTVAGVQGTTSKEKPSAADSKSSIQGSQP